MEANGVMQKESTIEAFRAVDRGFFCPDECKHEAYLDQPLKFGNLHMRCSVA